jgi:hypothetical protein
MKIEDALYLGRSSQAGRHSPWPCERASRRFARAETEPTPNSDFFVPPEQFRLPLETREQGYCAARQRPTIDPCCRVEPEQHLWKVCMDTASSNCDSVEWITFLLFGVLAFAATVSSFSELFHLICSGSVEHTVRALLTR